MRSFKTSFLGVDSPACGVIGIRPKQRERGGVRKGGRVEGLSGRRGFDKPEERSGERSERSKKRVEEAAGGGLRGASADLKRGDEGRDGRRAESSPVLLDGPAESEDEPRRDRDGPAGSPPAGDSGGVGHRFGSLLLRWRPVSSGYGHSWHQR